MCVCVFAYGWLTSGPKFSSSLSPTYLLAANLARNAIVLRDDGDDEWFCEESWLKKAGNSTAIPCDKHALGYIQVDLGVSLRFLPLAMQDEEGGRVQGR